MAVGVLPSLYVFNFVLAADAYAQTKTTFGNQAVKRPAHAPGL